MSAKYGPKSHDKVEEKLQQMKRGTLKSGRSGQTVTDPKQAIAIGLSEARKAGGKLPARSAPRTKRARMA